jgi:hypothetical protein
MEKYKVTRAGAAVGEASVYAEGLRTVIEARCAPSGGGVLRLAAVCGGEYITLGVAAPSGGELTFRKAYSKNALRELGFTEPEYFALVKSGEVAARPPLGAAIAELLPEAVGAAVGVFAPQPVARLTEAVAERIVAAGGELAAKIADTVPHRSTPPEPVAPELPPEPETAAETESQPLPEIIAEPEIIELAAAPQLLPEPAYDPPAPELPERENESAVTGYAPPETEAETPEPGGWSRIADPKSLFAASGFAAVTREVRGALTRTDGDVSYLAVPFDADAEFPMMPVFCFGVPETLGGRDYLVFRLKNGILTV